MLAFIPPRGPGGNGPPPDEFFYFLIAGGVALVAFLVWAVVRSHREGRRSQETCALVLATGLRARARVILLVELPKAPGTYTFTLEVAAAPVFVAKSMATVPLAILPSIQVGAELSVRYDVTRENVMIEDPRITCHLA